MKRFMTDGLSLLETRLEILLKEWGGALRQYQVLMYDFKLSEKNYASDFSQNHMVFMLEKWVQDYSVLNKDNFPNAMALRAYYYYIIQHPHGTRKPYLEKLAKSYNISVRTLEERVKYAKIYLTGCLYAYDQQKINDENSHLITNNNFEILRSRRVK